MWQLYVFGIACPILWTLAILELVVGINSVNDYRSVKLKNQKIEAIRSFILSGILFGIAIYSTVKLITAMKGLG